MVRQFMNNWKAFLDHSAPLFLLLSILSHCQRKNEHFSINWRNFFSFECKKICFWYTSKYYKVGVSINGIVMVVGKSLVIISLYSLPIGLTGQFGFQHLQRIPLIKALLSSIQKGLKSTSLHRTCLKTGIKKGPYIVNLDAPE